MGSIKKCSRCGFRLNIIYIRHKDKMVPTGHLCKICKIADIDFTKW